MKTGLNVIPRTQIDGTRLQNGFEKAGLHAEWNAECGCFFLEEELESYDALEAQIDEIFAGSEINYRIEGMF